MKQLAPRISLTGARGTLPQCLKRSGGLRIDQIRYPEGKEPEYSGRLVVELLGDLEATTAVSPIVESEACGLWRAPGYRAARGRRPARRSRCFPACAGFVAGTRVRVEELYASRS